MLLFDQCAYSPGTTISGPMSCVDSFRENRYLMAPSANESEESILRELYELVASGNRNDGTVVLPDGLDSPNNGDFLELDDLFPVCNDEGGGEYKEPSTLVSFDMPQCYRTMVSNVLQQDCIQPTTPEVIIYLIPPSCLR